MYIRNQALKSPQQGQIYPNYSVFPATIQINSHFVYFSNRLLPGLCSVFSSHPVQSPHCNQRIKPIFKIRPTKPVQLHFSSSALLLSVFQPHKPLSAINFCWNELSFLLCPINTYLSFRDLLKFSLFRYAFSDFPDCINSYHQPSWSHGTWHNSLVCKIICLIWLPNFIQCCRRAVAVSVTIVNLVPATQQVLNKYLWNECIIECVKKHLVFVQ